MNEWKHLKAIAIRAEWLEEITWELRSHLMTHETATYANRSCDATEEASARASETGKCQFSELVPRLRRPRSLAVSILQFNWHVIVKKAAAKWFRMCRKKRMCRWRNFQPIYRTSTMGKSIQTCRIELLINYEIAPRPEIFTRLAAHEWISRLQFSGEFNNFQFLDLWY